MPYVNQRWLGGMLTNFQTVHKRLQRLKELEDMEQTGVLVSLSKKEQLVLSREKAKLERSLGGIRDMQKVPERHLDRRHQEGAHRRRRGPQARHPGRRDPRHQLRPRRGRLQDPGQRRRHPQRRPADPRDRRRRRRRASWPARPRRPTPAARTAPAIGGDEPLADWERELLTGGTPEAAAAEAAAAPAELPETPAQPPTVTAEQIAPVEGVPATGDPDTGTQGAQNG
jgi:small subunit ribosomal protein S2